MRVSKRDAHTIPHQREKEWNRTGTEYHIRAYIEHYFLQNRGRNACQLVQHGFMNEHQA